MSSIDKIFQDQLSNHSSHVSSDIWDAVEKDLNSMSATNSSSSVNATSTSFSSIAGTLSLVLALGSLGYLISSSQNTNRETTYKEPLVKETKIAISETFTKTLETPKIINEAKELKELTSELQQVSVAEKTTTPIKTTPTKAPVIKNTKNTDNIEPQTEPLKDITQESSKKEKTDLDTPVPTIQEEKVENIKQKEKVYKTGEYVTFTIKFNNTSGKDVQSFKIWEEFPEWCDASTLQTTDYNSSHTINTIHKNQQNTVEWKVKGNFSANTNDPSNSGFIEYKIKLTEDRKASELAKNQPEVD